MSGPESSAATAFFHSSGDGFEASVLTRGPWDASSQHAGPPAALIGRAIELHPASKGGDAADLQVARVTYEILGPVPIEGRLRVEVTTERPGRRVEMLGARLLGPGDVELVRARAWRIARRELDVPAELASDATGSPAQRAGRPSGAEGLPPDPDDVEADDAFFPGAQDVGYHTAMEYRFAAGSFVEPGPATAWMRMRQPLVAGEDPSPLQRVLVAADSGNGISSTLDFGRFVFINVDLTVHLHRLPAGEWVCLDSLTVPEATGIGLSDTLLYDERGPLGRAAQSLLVAER